MGTLHVKHNVSHERIEVKEKRMYYPIQTLIFSFCTVHLLFFFSCNNFGSLDGASPSIYRRKIALMSDRKWQSGGEQRKRKKLVSKGKLISSHFVSMRNQPSSASHLSLFCIEYSRVFVHHPFFLFHASNPADPINILRKDQQRVCDIGARQKGSRTR